MPRLTDSTNSTNPRPERAPLFHPKIHFVMRKTLLHVLLSFLFCIAIVARAQPSTPSLAVQQEIEPTRLKKEYHDLTTRLIAEYLATGFLSPDSIQAHQLLVGIAAHRGVRLTKTPLRTNDERNLGPALLIARLESLGLTYERIYQLNLRASLTPQLELAPKFDRSVEPFWKSQEVLPQAAACGGVNFPTHSSRSESGDATACTTCRHGFPATAHSNA